MSNTNLNAIAIDDDDLIRESLPAVFPDHWNLQCFSDIPSDIPFFNLALVDIHLSSDHSKREGLQIIKKLNTKYPNAEIIAISGDADRVTMEDTIKHGASRYLLKPLSPVELELTIKRIENLILLNRANARGHSTQGAWIGDSDSAADVRKKIAQYSVERGPILIEGESGTGKEVTANLLMDQSQGKPKIVVNVASIPEALFESEFYGHVKGAFTGATQNKIGLAEAAHGGDLFLDEIEALPLGQQAKLLRFLESGEIRKVGAQEVQILDVRIIAATNKSLTDMVKKEEFREDLLWRLNGLKITLPSLRQRKKDIPSLVKYFSETIRPRRNKSFSPEALDALMAYDWPGNVRELKRFTERVLVESPLPIIRPEDIEKLLHFSPSHAPSRSMDLSRGLSILISEYEADIITGALKKDSDIDATAKLLNISRSSLYKKMKDHNISSKGTE